MGPVIGAHRRRWGQPFGAHIRRGNIRGDGETSVGPDIGAHRIRWGQPFGAHIRRGNIRGASHSASTGEGGDIHRSPQAIVAHMAIVAHGP